MSMQLGNQRAKARRQVGRDRGTQNPLVARTMERMVGHVALPLPVERNGRAAPGAPHRRKSLTCVVHFVGLSPGSCLTALPDDGAWGSYHGPLALPTFFLLSSSSTSRRYGPSLSARRAAWHHRQQMQRSPVWKSGCSRCAQSRVGRPVGGETGQCAVRIEKSTDAGGLEHNRVLRQNMGHRVCPNSHRRTGDLSTAPQARSTPETKKSAPG